MRMRLMLNSILGDLRQIHLKNAFKKINPDIVIHTNMGPRGDDALKQVIINNIPYILDIQLADEFLWHSYANAAVNCYKNAKAVYFLSAKNRNATEKQLGLKLGNAKRHFNPIKISPSIPQMQINNTIKFVCLGRMGVEHKRQDLILEILGSDTWKNRNWELHFCGGGEHMASLKHLVKMYQLEHKVIFKGQVENVSTIWEECHALLLPSMYEGMSLSVLECMQAGRVPIVTNTGGNSEYIVEGEHGFIAEAATFNLFSATMEKAWNQRNNWAAIGIKAQQHLKEIMPVDAAVFFAQEIISYL